MMTEELGNKVRVETWSDADLAGDEISLRSTSGWLIAVKSGNNSFPVSWGCKLQTATSRSTGEAEVVAIAHCTKEAPSIHAPTPRWRCKPSKLGTPRRWRTSSAHTTSPLPGHTRCITTRSLMRPLPLPMRTLKYH
eukprot:Selendium_serpulae@DN10103_c0_g1_i1.p2